MARVSVFLFLWIFNVVFVGDLQTVVITFPTFAICIFNVGKIRNSNLTVADMFWFVYFLFFVISPIQVLSERFFDESSPVGGIFFFDEEIYMAAAIVFIFALVATVVGRAVAEEPEALAKEARFFELTASRYPGLLAALFLSFFAYVVLSGGFGNVMASRFDKEQGTMSIFRVVATGSQLALTFIIGTIALKRTEPGGGSALAGGSAFGIALFLLLLTQNPFNTARYFLVQSWLPVILLFLRNRVRAMTFYFACLFGIVVLLPIFSLTSRFGTSFGEALANVDIAKYAFHLPYMDVFDMLVYEVRYVDETALSYGNRTLGAVLFFVPRALWSGKSELIGIEMGEILLALRSAGTQNLSVFFGGEFYADFGLFGVAGLGALFSFLYMRYVHNRPILVNGLPLRDLMILSAIPIVVRGPIGANASLIFMELVMLTIYVHIFSIGRGRRRASMARL